MLRKIVEIDEAKCDGCGLCVPSCEEGAIKVIDGKARLISEVYCDGLGACLGHCPQNAIRVTEREAQAFDEEAVHEHLARQQRVGLPHGHASVDHGAPRSASGGCPGSSAQMLNLPVVDNPRLARPPLPTPGSNGSDADSRLRNWPIQIHLVPPNAPYFNDADLLVAADCVPFAYADFHDKLLKENPVVVGCPKLDDGQAYVRKLTAILRMSSVRSLNVLRMEVPCCAGMTKIAEAAVADSGRDVPVDSTIISLRGEVVEC
jgi:NAD-dependent dihydropyrimidine dehydrogenase PreA subunit